MDIPRNGILVSCVSRVHPGKGQQVLLEAAGKIVRKNPNVYFLIVGEELVTPLENLGFTTKLKQLAVEYSIIIVQPSFEEPFGLSVMESLAVGIPVVVSSTGGLPEIVQDGRTGLAFEPGNSVQLAQCIEELLADLKLRKQIGQAGQKYVREKFSLDDRAKFILGIYRNAIHP